MLDRYMHLVGVLLLFFSAFRCHVSASSVLPIAYLTELDKNNFRSVFDSAPLDEIKSVYYTVLGRNAIGDTNMATETFCSLFQKHASNTLDNLEILDFAVSGAFLIGLTKCKIAVPNFHQLITSKMTKATSADDLQHLVSIATKLNQQVDTDVIMKLLDDLRKKDSSALNLANIFATVSMLNLSKATQEVYLSEVKHVLAQADELEGRYLYYEAGVYTTAVVVNSIFKLAEAAGKSPDISEQQLIKLANFFYSRKHMRQLRATAYLVVALKTLNTNSFMIPIVVTGVDMEAPQSVITALTSSNQLHISLTTMFGDFSVVPNFDIAVVGLYRVSKDESQVNLLTADSRKQLKPSSVKGQFVIDLSIIKDNMLSHGSYRLELSASMKKNAKSPSIVGLNKALIPVRVLSTVVVNAAHLKVSSSDLPLTVNTKVKSPSNLAGSEGSVRVQINEQIKVYFSLTDSSTKQAVEPHQVFIQFTHTKTQQSITYLCVKSSTPGTYTFALTPSSAANEFSYLTGVYSMELIVGDAFLANSFSWIMADLDIHLPVNDNLMSNEDISRRSLHTSAGSKRSSGVNPRIGTGPNKMKPELTHTFRIPEPRPSNTIAFAFTGLCLAPFVGLLLSWLVIGVNIWNFPCCSLSAIVFHTSLTAMFGLYIAYWLELNMFTTLRYASFIGLLIFLSGHRLLSSLGCQRRATSSEK